MGEQRIRMIDIDDRVCPSCATPTLGLDLAPGTSRTVDKAGNKSSYYWWKASCATCRTLVERHWVGTELLYDGSLSMVITEEVEETAHGKAVRELRELREGLAVAHRE